MNVTFIRSVSITTVCTIDSSVSLVIHSSVLHMELINCAVFHFYELFYIHTLKPVSFFFFKFDYWGVYQTAHTYEKISIHSLSLKLWLKVCIREQCFLIPTLGYNLLLSQWERDSIKNLWMSPVNVNDKLKEAS